jgi:methionyl-tRNA formyltransferase
MNEKKIAFYLMTYKGYQVLINFVETFASDSIELVIIGMDKNIENDYSEEIKQFCVNNQIPFFFRNQEYDIESEYIFAISWRWIIKSEKKIIVLHDSLLPRYRGFAPLVNCLINNETEIGVTALFANENYDCGEIIAQQSIKIIYPITINDAIEKITPLYSKLVKLISNQYFLNYNIASVKQNEAKATYSLWRDEEDYFINWNDTAANIKRFIDAVGFPYKGACTYMDGQFVRVKNALVETDVKIENRDIGKVIFFSNNCPVVVCREGLLRLDNIVDEKNRVIQCKKFRLRFK